VAGIEGTLLAVGDRGEPPAGDPVAHEIILGRAGALLAERQVVLDRAALVTVSLDDDLRDGALAEILPVLLQRGLGVLAQREVVEVEKRILERKPLSGRFHGRRRHIAVIRRWRSVVSVGGGSI